MTSIKCPECKLTNWATAITCKRCGCALQSSLQYAGFVPPQSSFNESSADTDQANSVNNPPFQTPEYQTPNLPPPNYYQRNNQSYGHQTYNYRQPANLKNGLGIASMVFGILSFVLAIFLIGILLAPIGLILGIVALVKANKKPHIYDGKGYAVVGIVTSAMIVLIIPIVFAIAIPNLLAARRAANEGSAISSLRTIASAEQTYQSTAGQGKCGDLSELAGANLIPAQMATTPRNGYKYLLVKIPSIYGGCEITATPTVSKGVSATGNRSFYYSTDDGLIRAGAKNGQLADRNDLPLNSDSSNYPNQIPQSR